jgi:hypothetical protein
MLSSAQARRNDFIPWSSLPPELLGRIFECLVPNHASISHLRFPKLNRCNTIWVAVTSVCKRWRAVALAHAALWSTISTLSKQPWDVFLQRSRTTPLFISAAVSNCTPEYIQHIAHRFDRIHALSLLTESRKDWSIMALVSDVTTAPELQVLGLSRATKFTGDQLSLVLPPNLFSEVAPNIRHVELRNFQFPWTTTAPHIVSLEVNAEWAVPAENITGFQIPEFFTVHDVLQCLSRMPNLQQLALTHLPDSLPLFRNTTPRSSSEPDSITLPHVITMSFGGQARQCVRFCRLLKAHPMAHILVHTSQSFHEDGLEDVISSLKQRFHAPGHPTLTTLSLEMSFASRLSLIAKTSPTPPADSETVSSTNSHCFEIVSKSPQLPPAQSAAATALCSTIPLTRIHHLTLSFPDDRTRDEWTPLLLSLSSAALKSLNILSMSPFEFVELCEALTALTKANQPPIFPSLENLTCDYLNFNSRANVAGPAIQALSMLLASRTEAGRSPRVLGLKACTIRKELVRELEAFVEVLDWDGDEWGCDTLEWEEDETESEQEGESVNEDEDGSEDENEGDDEEFMDIE